MTIQDDLLSAKPLIGEAEPDMQAATLLVAIAHQTRDREIWGGDRAITYWDRLPDKVRSATYAAPTLPAWWERMTRTLGCGAPGRKEDRQALAIALSDPQGPAVLRVLRGATETVCLRVRIAVQAARETREAIAS